MPPSPRQDVITTKRFCSWCTAWRSATKTDLVGYIEPDLQVAALESERYQDWVREIRRLEKLEEVGRDDDPEEHSDVSEENGSRDENTDESYGYYADNNEEIEELSDSDTASSSVVINHSFIRLPDVRDSASTCFLCNKVWESFVQWATKNYGSPSCIDMAASIVAFGNYWLNRLPEADERLAGIQDENDGVHGRLCFLEVNIHVPNPENAERSLGLGFRLQKSYEVAPCVEDIFSGTEQTGGEHDAALWPDHEPYIARRRPLVADMRLFRKWRALCSATHDDRCRPGQIFSSGRSRLAAIRLVDVDAFCLVEIEDVESVSWVALSYVWGATPFRTLTEDALQEFKQAGALSASWVPNTIADAIQVTRGLGERYIWIDSICIMQDSDEDKAKVIPCMDFIFGRASVTIINASGDSAFSGLPGDSKWFTRAWAFQEAVLSTRWLIFTPEQVLWECRQGSWREDGCWELPHHREKNQTVIFEPAFSHSQFQDLWTPRSAQKFDETYRYLVDGFTSRDLNREGDGLDAFSGILRALTQVFKIEFFWGLPKPFLGVALTWPTSKRKMRRRNALCRLEVTEGERTPTSGFPSWSWIGWVGPVNFQDFVGYLDDHHAGLEFYHLENDRAGGTVVIQHIPQNQIFRNEYEKTTKGADSSWRVDTTLPIELSDVPSGLLQPELRHTVLAFWTSCSELYLQYDKTPSIVNQWHSEHFSLWADDVTKLRDTMWDQYPPVPADFECDEDIQSHRSIAQCIVVARDSSERLRGRAYITVLLVTRHPSGGLSREGQLSIGEGDWCQLQNRAWKRVFLI
ncbi:HET-domain-containing protein [Nemania sp. FL0916]|nr:HET-domain-containing protein [Nemania sp. FL0916]